MSRTNKDAPSWTQVSASDVVPVHLIRCRLGWRECDLPDAPTTRRSTVCHWSNPARQQLYLTTKVPSWYINHVWNAPERLRARVTLLDAVKDYRANGDTDIEPDPHQHRHCAQALWD